MNFLCDSFSVSLIPYRLTPDQTQSMIIEPTSKNSDVVRGTDIGKRVGQFGDELESIRAKMQDDQVFQDFVDNAVRGRDSRRASVNAFEEFTTIANQVLEVGDTGVGEFSDCHQCVQ